MSGGNMWAPWRIEYILGEKPGGCVLCDMPQGGDDERNHIVHRGVSCYVIMNLYPYNSGHLLLVLNRHAARLSECTPAELADMARLLKVMEDALGEAFRPDGINCGYNGGSSAGAGIPGHLHLHMLPRWHGDTNFMSTVGETRVMPQTLDQAWERLKPVVDRLVAAGTGA